MKNYRAIGLMSGTSCDGLDIAYCEFNFDTKWTYRIIRTKMVEYSSVWQEKLRNAYLLSPSQLELLDNQLGRFFGEETALFMADNSLTEIDFVASHGHTVFHQPDKGITVQIGCGKELKNRVKTPVIHDFRSADVAAGGQGAPLVPIGDELLFSEFDFCLNIGGIANVSYNKNGVREAQDVCFANMALNPLSREIGYEFDRGGYYASQGIINPRLLRKLMEVNFEGKSLGNEQYVSHLKPILDESISTVDTKMRTLTEYIGLKIAEIVKPNSEVLITGGGAYNTFLTSRISALTNANIIKATPELIEFKEAMIFAFLGVLKMENIPNCLSSVTGAKEDVVGGVVV